MTVAVGWIRKYKNIEELIFASDSRLCGGYRWDSCPKIMCLPRNDCAIAFAGDTGYAYPLMMQAYFASGETHQAMDRAIDVVKFNGFLLSQINAMQAEVFSKAWDDDINENEFLFGGYSWATQSFRLWRYRYNKYNKLFEKQEFDSIFQNRFGKIVFAGDAKDRLIKELVNVLKEKYGDDYSAFNGEGFDMEPFEALVSLLRKTNSEDTIGGPPQLVKIYRHMNCKPMGVYWPKKVDDLKNRTLLGRKLFDNEQCDFSFIDPDSCYSHKVFSHN